MNHNYILSSTIKIGENMKLKDINTSMPLPNQKQQGTKPAKKRDGAPTSGDLFKAELDKEKAKK